MEQLNLQLSENDLTLQVESAKYSRIENRKSTRHLDSKIIVPFPDPILRYIFYKLSEKPCSKAELIEGLGAKTPEKRNEIAGRLSILVAIDQVIELRDDGKYHVIDAENFKHIDFWGFTLKTESDFVPTTNQEENHENQKSKASVK